MAEGKPRTRRAERHQTPPDRVTEAARQMQQPQEPMPQMQQNGYGGFPQNEAWPQPNMPYGQIPDYQQQASQQQ
jgi:hypothetical protein